MTSSTVLWWVCTVLQLIGVFILAANVIPASYCYGILLLGSTAGIGASFLDRNTALFYLNIGFTASNLLGIVRWWP